MAGIVSGFSTNKHRSESEQDQADNSDMHLFFFQTYQDPSHSFISLILKTIIYFDFEIQSPPEV